MGVFNLLAGQESKYLEQKVSSIKKYQGDLLAAIAKLREAIDSLNTEGRQRLLAAYGVVNENFQKLFIQLFGGGKAYLKFTDETDPLQAGLEIYASPPGKKLQNLTLLSLFFPSLRVTRQSDAFRLRYLQSVFDVLNREEMSLLLFARI